MRILILDEDPQQQQFLSACLDNPEYHVLTAEDGETALEMLAREPVEVLLASFEMPSFSGLDLINGLLAAGDQPYPYVIFMTEADTEEDAIDCLGPIPGDYLLKPISEQDLRARLALAERSLTLQERLLKSSEQDELMAVFDAATGTLNRQTVYERAVAEVSRAERDGFPVTLAMIEVVDWQRLKDQYGSEVGDQLLRFVARATRANVRIYDILGRWADSRFLLILPGVSSRYAEKVVERVRKTIATISVPVPGTKGVRLETLVGVTTMANDEYVPFYMLIERVNSLLHAPSPKKQPQKNSS